MKKFQFQLEAALAWRRQKQQAEELRLEQLLARRQDLGRRKLQLEGEWEDSRKQMLAASSIQAFELQSLDAYRHALAADKRAIEAELQAVDEAAARQRSALQEAARQTRLIEKLKDRRRLAWQARRNQELESEASESYLGQWSRGRKS